MIKWIIKLFKSLNANAHPGEIAHAFACGMFLGFLPKTSALWYVFFLLFLFVRMNKGAFLLSILAGTLASPLLDGAFDAVGFAVLTYPSFEATFARLLDIPFVAFTRFNNTIVAGSIVVSAALYIPLYVCMRLFVLLWRKTLAPLLARNPIVKAILKMPLVRKIVAAVQKLELD